MCELSGVEYIGITELKGRHLIQFNDPLTKSTLGAWYENGFNCDIISEKVQTSREIWERKLKYQEKNP